MCILIILGTVIVATFLVLGSLWLVDKHVNRGIKVRHVNIGYSPLDDITVLETAWFVYIVANDSVMSKKRLLELLDEHKLRRHCFFSGVRGK